MDSQSCLTQICIIDSLLETLRLEGLCSKEFKINPNCLHLNLPPMKCVTLNTVFNFFVPQFPHP